MSTSKTKKGWRLELNIYQVNDDGTESPRVTNHSDNNNLDNIIIGGYKGDIFVTIMKIS